MKRLFNQFLKEQGIVFNGSISELELSNITKNFSLWLTGHIDKDKKKKRFQTSPAYYRVNKFMVRKFLEKLVNA